MSDPTQDQRTAHRRTGRNPSDSTTRLHVRGSQTGLFSVSHLAAIGWILAIALVTGCDSLPRDSAGALPRIQAEGKVRVGVAERPPWVVFGSKSELSGLEPELIQQWASLQGAGIEWHRGAVADLVDALHRREIDVLAAGLVTRTPHTPRLALTQPYLELTDGRGEQQQHVLAVTQGENALLLSLDRFLAAQARSDLQRRLKQGPRGEEPHEDD